MKMQSCRVLTHKDMEKSATELSDFEKLVEVCRVATELYYQEHPQQPNSYTNNNMDSFCCSSVFDQVGQGKKPIQEDNALFPMDEILAGSASCLPREELYKDSETNRGESTSTRFCKLKMKPLVDDHDSFGDKKLVKCNDCNEDFLNKMSHRFVEEKGFDGIRERKRSRKYLDSCEYDPDFVYSAEKKKKPRNMSNARQNVANVARVTSPMPVEFKNEIQEMGGTDIKLIIQKSLFSADTNAGQNRFSIPMKQIREDFLTDKEECTLDQRTKDKHLVPIMVPLIEPNLEKTPIKFRKWDVNSSYVLSCPWNDVRARNALKVGMEMQLWSFRVEGALNFALVKV